MASLGTLARHMPEEGCELILLDDGSTRDYSAARIYAENVIPRTRWVRLDPDPECYFYEDGQKNPARALNRAFAESHGEKIVLVASDTIVNSRAMKAALAHDPSRGIMSTGVYDIEQQSFYCGPQRLFPSQWFLTLARSTINAIGGWDEEYMKGFAFEDNDFVGRAALHHGQFFGAWDACVVHFSHRMKQIKDDPVLMEGLRRSQAHTRKKWGGIPFSDDESPFSITRGRNKYEEIVYAVARTKDYFEKEGALSGAGAP